MAAAIAARLSGADHGGVLIMSTLAKIKRGGDDRSATAFFLFGAGAASIAFNVWAAHAIYSGLSAWIFAGGLLCIEVAAWLCLKHILRDYDNGHRAKPGFGLLLFGLIVIACAYMGWRAFDAKNIEIREENKVATRDAAEYIARADVHFAAAAAAIAAGNRGAEQTETSRGRAERAKADALLIKVEKRAEVPPFMAFVILAVFEGVKMFGRWSIATPSRKTPARIAADKAAEEAKPKRAYAARRPADQIAADKAAKANRQAARAGRHIAAAT